MDHPHNAGTVVAIDADFLYFIHLQNNHCVEDAEQQIISYIADYAGHGITDLTINWAVGNVTVIPSEGDSITVTEDYRDGSDADRLRWRVKDGKLNASLAAASSAGVSIL